VYAEQEHNELGVIPVAAIGGAISAIGGIFGGGGPDEKDLNRMAANTRAYEAAINGDANALLFLKHRTGRFGIHPGPIPGWEPGAVGGWATDTAKKDAGTKYDAAISQRTSYVAQQTGSGVAQASLLPGGATPLLLAGGVVLAAILMSRKK
jgi:hypothetical protein